MAPPILVTMVAAEQGDYRVDSLSTLSGEGLAPAPKFSVLAGRPSASATCAWSLSGATGAPRYTTRRELDALGAVQPDLGRKEASLAAMIALRKDDVWWSLAADERRKIFEEDSRHIAMSMRFLPAIARRLYHARELGEGFDFLTWFEFAPEHAGAFDELLAHLRASIEWSHVDREVELRLTRL